MVKKPRIIVVGDVMLDIYRYGDVDRISPEAPVPVVLIKESYKNLGGAGNTFANLYSLGCNCYLIGMVGRDRYGLIEIPELIHKKYPDAHYHFHQSKDHITILKERIIARTQQICRLDWEKPDVSLDGEDLDRVEQLLLSHLENCDVLIISDYAKGFINFGVMCAISKAKEKNNFTVILDPHPKNAYLYNDIDYVTPNRKEYDEIGITKFWDMGCKAIIRTEGADGMSIIQKEDGGDSIHLSTVAQQIYDVSGAGDTVSAVVGYMLGLKYSLIQAVTAANECAGVVVSKPGTVPIKRSEFDKILRRVK
jgi:D-beta-D-heptose 7-phosphate kinase/D-beta-D-heptose 1-phosphate adenosyltransferase